MARKKKTPSKTDVSEQKADSSKASAISGVVKDAEFDELDAAMADTKVEGVTLGDPDVEEAVEDAVISDEVVEAADAETDKAIDAIEEVEADEVVEAEVEEAAAPVQAAVERRGGFLGPLLGGALAAVIGFGGAIYFKAAEWPVFGGGDKFEALLAEQSEKISGLQAALDAAQSENTDARAALSTRIDEIPTREVAPLPEDVQATLEAQRAEMELLETTLEKMRTLTQDQIASAQAQQENAAEAEAKAKARGALNALRTALENGAPFAAIVPEVAAAVDVPEVLATNAETGILTAAALEEQFEQGARDALSASLKATAGESATDKLAFFIKDQLGARSLTPRDGDDPDAVLSRAEAAIKAGDLDAALNTIEALPAEGKAALENWAGVAATRRDALAAFNSLSDALNAN
ncbi:MAG: hypothetical protein ABJN34_06425 [Litoreibacter sp.]|uniref:COG4223 family protein n=1 Tax=Litoreibacter sp. TaxID=1969459 RepID=UPI00329A068D